MSVPCSGKAGDADGRRHRHLLSGQSEGLHQRFAKGPGHGHRRRLVRLDQQGKLVAGHARHRGAGLGSLGQMRRRGAQQFVACLVAEAVVEFLESVDIDDQQRQRRLHGRGLGKLLTHAVPEQGAIGQAGQGVVEGEVFEFLVGGAEALVETLQFALRLLRHLPRLLQGLDGHGVLDGDRRLPGEQFQKMQVVLVELAAAAFGKTGDAPQELPPPHQRHQDQGAGLLLPEIPFLVRQLGQGAPPPGPPVPQHPAADAIVQGQGFADDLVRLGADASPVGVLVVIVIDDRYQHRLGTDQGPGTIGDQGKDRVQLELAADGLGRLAQQGDLPVALAQFRLEDGERFGRDRLIGHGHTLLNLAAIARCFRRGRTQ